MNDSTLLIVPPNDPEAVLIHQIAKAMDLLVHRSPQAHGATLDQEKDVVEKVKESGAKRVVIVEIPGVKTEDKIKKLGVEVVIIDHHQYTDLDRSRDMKTGKSLPSSMFQFLKLFKLGDVRLKKLGFDPRLVRGIAIMDQAYVWGAERRGYSWKEIGRLMEYQDELMATVRSQAGEKRKLAVVKKAWDAREAWNGFFIVQSKTNTGLRSRLSRIVALEMKKPTPLIIVEKGRGFIYVQESPRANKLFKTFGGFTFGEHRNWGYKNAGATKKITLKDVQNALV